MGVKPVLADGSKGIARETWRIRNAGSQSMPPRRPTRREEANRPPRLGPTRRQKYRRPARHLQSDNEAGAGRGEGQEPEQDDGDLV